MENSKHVNTIIEHRIHFYLLRINYSLHDKIILLRIRICFHVQEFGTKIKLYQKSVDTDFEAADLLVGLVG